MVGDMYTENDFTQPIQDLFTDRGGGMYTVGDVYTASGKEGKQPAGVNTISALM